LAEPSLGPEAWGIPAWAEAAIVLTVVMITGISGLVVYAAEPGFDDLCPPIYASCPEAWSVAPGGIAITPGAPGCENVSGVACFEETLQSNQPGMQLSDFWFELVGPPVNSSNSLSGPLVPLGASAAVSAFDSAGAPIGVWNASRGMWIWGGGWIVDANVELVLDTGLQNSTLYGDYVCTFLTGTHEGELAPMCLYSSEYCPPG
jgi:hypothetical protein